MSHELNTRRRRRVYHGEYRPLAFEDDDDDDDPLLLLEEELEESSEDEEKPNWSVYIAPFEDN